MKYLKFAAIALLFGVLTTLSWVGITHAAPVMSRVSKNQIVDSSIYAAGKTVRIEGVVNGDVHCAGQDVTVSGTVNGDVLCAGQNVTISGTVTGSVRAAAQDLWLKGTVGRSVSLAGDMVHIEKSARIGQDATIAGNSLELRGTIARDAMLASSRADVYGTVGRNTVFNGTLFKVQDGAMLGGTVRYTSNRSIEIGDNARVNGPVTHVTERESRRGIGALPLAAILLAGFVFAMILVLIWPRTIHATSEIAVQRLGKTLLVGLVAAIVGPIVTIMLLASVIGAPLGILLLLAGLLIALLGGPIAAYYLGSMILAKSKNPVTIMAIGAAVLLIAYLVPVVGFFAMMLAYLLGTGAIVIRIKERTPKPEYRI